MEFYNYLPIHVFISVQYFTNNLFSSSMVNENKPKQQHLMNQQAIYQCVCLILPEEP